MKRSIGSGILCAALAVLLAFASARPTHALRPFVRGKVQGSFGLALVDVIATLGTLFQGLGFIHCEDGADSNDDGRVDVSDAIYTLSYLFLGTPAPPPPFSGCGTDPTPDGLGCDRSDECNPCSGPCPEGDVCVEKGPEDFVCASALASCEEAEAAYEYLTREESRACRIEIPCHVLLGHCGIGIGGCYYVTASGVEQYQLDAIAARFTQLGCLGPVCDCAPLPARVDCVDGVCKAIPAPR